MEYFLGVVIVGAKRTPFGTYGGKFTKIASVDLQTVANKAALTAANVKPELIDTIVVGNVLTVSFSILEVFLFYNNISRVLHQMVASLQDIVL